MSARIVILLLWPSILTLAQVRALSVLHPHVIHVCDLFFLISFLYFLSSCRPCSSSFSSSSPTGSSWQTFTTPPRRVWTLLASSPSPILITLEKWQSKTSPNSFMRQSERKPSRTRSPRGKCPSGRMSRWPCKDYLRGTCNNSFCERWHPSRMLVLHDHEWLPVCGKVLSCTSSGWWTADYKVQKEWWQKCSNNAEEEWLAWKCTETCFQLCGKVTIDQGDLMKSVITSWNEDLLDVEHLTHDTWFVYFRTWSRRSLFSGRAQTCRDQSIV